MDISYKMRRDTNRSTPMYIRLCFFLLVFILVQISQAKNGSEPLNHYGLTILQDESIGIKLAGRFKAKGQPVFMVHDANLGLMQGDIMRFQDKVVLVDADVWQTLQDEGALGHLKIAPLVRVQAKATVPTWETRAKLVTSPREKKAYQLGSELLKILEETFGGIPGREQVTIVFDGPSLVLLAPEDFLDQLKYSTVRRVPTTGAPHFISEPPEKTFMGHPFSWKAWAADPAEPTGTLRYSLFGDLPKGMTWDAAAHELKGEADAEGQWRLLAEARNKSGQFDTMGFTLVIRKNVAPLLAFPPKSVAVAGQLFSYQAEAVDFDHEGSQIRISPHRMPQGMEYDSVTHRFQWYPSVDRAGEEVPFDILVQDPEGGNSKNHFTIKIIPANEMLWSEGIKPTLPWDTLQQGKAYTWVAGASALAWSQQGIKLTQITGPDSTVYTNDTLHIRPMHADSLTLVFTFDVQGKSIEQPVTLPVRPNLAPRFKSEIGAWKFLTGQHATYRPVAIDAENDPIEITSDVLQDPQFEWDGERLNLNPEIPGTYCARLIASDPAGHSDAQWVVYKVDKAERPTAWFLETLVEAGITSWIATADFGTGRMGIYTPDLERTGVKGSSGQRHWPYLFFGGNLMGRENEKRGRRLWVDAGLTLRFPNAKVASGGVFGRLLGEWAFPNEGLGKVELELQGHVGQAIVVADTSNLQAIYGNAILDFANKYSDVIDGIIKEATAKDNMVLYSRLEVWSRLGAGFWAGPGMYREDMPNAQKYFQRIGAGLRYEIALKETRLTNSFHAGWGSGEAGWSVYWSGRLSYGSPF